MILKIIINLFGIVVTFFINIVNGLIPNNNLHQSLGTFITSILSITQQALNFMYLIFGETLFIVLPIISILLFTKYVTLPIVQICRSFFIKGNE